MPLSGKKKAKEKVCCGGNHTSEKIKIANMPRLEGASVKILGSGCSKCKALEKATKEALAMLNMDTRVEHVTDFAQIALYGVMTTPALVVDEKVLSYGKVLQAEEVCKLLQKAK